MAENERPIEDGMMSEHIRADRACIGCGFNLYGQSVFKEEHYGLAIARCPECGEVAALQTYPTMSHWVNRFRTLLAGVWVVALLFAFILQSMLIGTYADSVGQSASDQLARKIGEAYYNWAEDNGQTTSIAAWGGTPESYYQWVQIPSDWADEHLDGVIAEFGGLWSNFDRSSVIYVIPASIAAFMMGVFWSVVLLGADRKRVAIVPLVACVLVMAMMLIEFSSSFMPPQASEVAKALYINVLAPIAIIVQLPALFLGVFFGRKIARWIIILTLPPRSRVSLSMLWTRDGLELPRP